MSDWDAMKLAGVDVTRVMQVLNGHEYLIYGTPESPRVLIGFGLRVDQREVDQPWLAETSLWVASVGYRRWMPSDGRRVPVPDEFVKERVEGTRTQVMRTVAAWLRRLPLDD